MTFILHSQLQADTALVCDLTLCRVLLMNEQRYPWLILVPRQNNISELDELDNTSFSTLMDEWRLTMQLMRSLFQPDKLNTAVLGNQVPQLHLHVIARFKKDAAWPKPVWGLFERRAYESDILEERLCALRQAYTQNKG